MSTPSSSDRLRRLAAIAAVAAIAAGCHRAETPDELAARSAVVRYNRQLVEAYRTRNLGALDAVATEAEKARVDRIVTGLLTRGRFMVARQEEMRVEGIELPSPNRAAVKTRERWIYEHRSLGAPETPVSSDRAEYRLTYRLHRVPAGWLVDAVEDRR